MRFFLIGSFKTGHVSEEYVLQLSNLLRPTQSLPNACPMIASYSASCPPPPSPPHSKPLACFQAMHMPMHTFVKLIEDAKLLDQVMTQATITEGLFQLQVVPASRAAAFRAGEVGAWGWSRR